MPYIQFLGAAGVVTGSKHLISTTDDVNDTAGFRVLIDCGLFQGQKEWRERNWRDTPIPARTINAVILTHAHLDHCGWIPRLVKEGFRGPIYATQATIDLCSVVLPIQGTCRKRTRPFITSAARRSTSPRSRCIPSKTRRTVCSISSRSEVGQTIQLNPQLSFRFVPAAHILGSCMAEIALSSSAMSGTTPSTTNAQTRRLLFTGDIGRVRDGTIAPGKVVHSGPQEGETADVLVMESTYGNRRHPDTDPRPQLASLIRDTVTRGGSVIVPAFAVERTQKFIFMLKEMMESGQIPRVPVYCDSPMAIKAVEIFIKHSEDYTVQAADLIKKYGSPMTWPGYTFAETSEESKKINDNNFPSIIVSSSGMVTGGRISTSPGAGLPNPKNLVIFIGFQAPGTRGAIIKDGAKEVKIFGEFIPIRAQIAALEQFSDHADPPELLEWLHTFKNQPGVTYLVHGEPAASSQLRDLMKKDLGWNVQVAEYMERVKLN